MGLRHRKETRRRGIRDRGYQVEVLDIHDLEFRVVAFLCDVVNPSRHRLSLAPRTSTTDNNCCFDHAHPFLTWLWRSAGVFEAMLAASRREVMVRTSRR